MLLHSLWVLGLSFSQSLTWLFKCQNASSQLVKTYINKSRIENSMSGSLLKVCIRGSISVGIVYWLPLTTQVFLLFLSSHVSFFKWSQLSEESYNHFLAVRSSNAWCAVMQHLTLTAAWLPTPILKSHACAACKCTGLFTAILYIKCKQNICAGIKEMTLHCIFGLVRFSLYCILFSIYCIVSRKQWRFHTKNKSQGQC